MDTLEVCISRIISCLAECLKACLHECAHTATENCLLTEKIGLGLGAEGCLKHTSSCSTDAKCIGKRQILCLAGRILLYSDQTRSTLSCLVLGTNSMPRSLRSDHGNIDILRRYDTSKMNVESMCEH